MENAEAEQRLVLKVFSSLLTRRCFVRCRLSLSAFSIDADLASYYLYISRLRGRVRSNVFLMIIVTASDHPRTIIYHRLSSYRYYSLVDLLYVISSRELDVFRMR
jgi:hypothetical protein